MTEHELQNKILHWLNMHPEFFAWRNQSQGTFRDGRWLRKVGFDIKGVSDILGIQRSSGRLIAIEVKSEKGRATKEQQAFVNKINACGGMAIITNNFEEVKTCLLQMLSTGSVPRLPAPSTAARPGTNGGPKD